MMKQKNTYKEKEFKNLVSLSLKKHKILLSFWKIVKNSNY